MSASSSVNDKDLDRISKSLHRSENLGFLCHMNTKLGNQADHETQKLRLMDPMTFCGKVLKMLLCNYKYFNFYSFILYWK